MQKKSLFIFFGLLAAVFAFAMVPSATNAQTINSPPASSWQNDPSFTVSVTDIPGTQFCDYHVEDSVDGLTVPFTPRPSCPGGDPSISVGAGKDCRTEGPNTCDVTVFAEDAFFNITQTSRKFSIDYTKPTGLVHQHTPDPVDGSVAVVINSSGLVLGGDSGLAEINVLVDDGDADNFFDDYTRTCSFLNNCSVTIPKGDLGPGEVFRYYMTARDVAGNFVMTSGAPGTFTVTAALDTTPPTASINASPSPPNNTQSVLFEASADDTASGNSGISSLEIWVNGILVQGCAAVFCDVTSGPWTSGTIVNYFAKATDGSANETITVTQSFTVTAAPAALTADAGPDATITLPTNTHVLQGSVSGNAAPVTYSWLVVSTPLGGSVTFGPNAAEEDPTAEFSPVTGTYKLSLTVAEGFNTHTDNVTITVFPAGAINPTADFTFTSTNLDVTVTDASTPGSPWTLVPGGTWVWDWDDATAKVGQGPHTHTYASAGIYNIKLTVTDSGGFSDSETKSVTVPVDTDGDGYSDADENLAGSDPNDPNETPGSACTPIPCSAGKVCQGGNTCVAGGGGGPGVITFVNPLGATTFTELINNIIDFIFTIAVIVAPILLVVAGIIFMTAAGDPTKVATARRMLLWTIVGFGVILISKGLVEVLKGILGI